LIAQGLARRYTSTVGLYQLLLTLLGAGLVSVVASVTAIGVLTSTAQRRLLLDIPWGFIAVTVASCVMVCVLVFLLAFRPWRARPLGDG
jgi:uncharacterized BrkB/YihY/UPF0761 family membrane protein